MKSKNEKYGKGIDLYLPTNSKKKKGKGGQTNIQNKTV